MYDGVSFRMGIFIAIIVIILLGGFTIFFSPLFVLSIFYFDSNNIVISPVTENYIYLTLSFVVLIIGLAILAWRRKFVTYNLFTLSLLMFVALYYASTIGHFVIHDEYVRVQSAFNKQQFAWPDIEKIYYEYEVGFPGTYTFYSGENVVTITETGQFTSGVSSEITKRAHLYDIPFEKQQKK